MKRLGVFVDVSNLYYCVDKQYHKKIDYAKYLDYIKDLGDIKFAHAYAAVMGNQADGFLHALRELRFDVKTRTPKEYSTPGGGIKRKCDFDVQIAMDIVRRQPMIDMCILGSADGDLTPVVEYLNGVSIPTVILACGISHELAQSAKAAVEIPYSMLI
jgi:uncharacterized LabA/DUF88 family protein